ncbi:MAG TPA: hypothetical protein VMM93_06885, partial [Vicinamibacterales bacterium]|nr:hypothetical protein [Vicinamibacterales bacterium]
GRPVVALGRGGALETVVPGVTGLLVEGESVENLAEAMARVTRLSFDRAAIRRHAESYDTARFERAMHGLLTDALAVRH